MKIIGIDAMGGDFAPKETILGLNKVLKIEKDFTVLLYGDQEQINKYLEPNPRVTIVHTPDFVSMGEKDPIKVVRNNKSASLILGMNDLRDKKIDCLITAGPTQVIVVCGYLIVKRAEGMRRIALAPFIPTLDSKNKKILLDTGGNVTLDPQDLVDFGIYASTVCRTLLGIESPKCALLNIGTEEGKGREFEKEAFKLLSNCHKINFIGNIESKELLTTSADIILQDGFTNNIAIKALEGTAKLMGETLKKEIKSSLGGKIGYLFMRKNLKRFAETFNVTKVGGAMIFGLNGIVIKAHGASKGDEICNAIIQGYKLALSNIIERVSLELKNE